MFKYFDHYVVFIDRDVCIQMEDELGFSKVMFDCCWMISENYNPQCFHLSLDFLTECMIRWVNYSSFKKPSTQRSYGRYTCPYVLSVQLILNRWTSTDKTSHRCSMKPNDVCAWRRKIRVRNISREIISRAGTGGILFCDLADSYSY